MDVAALVLGILGTVGGLGWNIITFINQGARPKVRVVYGMEYGANGPVAFPKIKGTNAAVEAIRVWRDELKAEKLLVGLSVVNKGRSPFPNRRPRHPG